MRSPRIVMKSAQPSRSEIRRSWRVMVRTGAARAEEAAGTVCVTAIDALLHRGRRLPGPGGPGRRLSLLYQSQARAARTRRKLALPADHCLDMESAHARSRGSSGETPRVKGSSSDRKSDV